MGERLGKLCYLGGYLGAAVFRVLHYPFFLWVVLLPSLTPPISPNQFLVNTLVPRVFPANFSSPNVNASHFGCASLVELPKTSMFATVGISHSFGSRAGFCAASLPCRPATSAHRDAAAGVNTSDRIITQRQREKPEPGTTGHRKRKRKEARREDGRETTEESAVFVLITFPPVASSTPIFRPIPRPFQRLLSATSQKMWNCICTVINPAGTVVEWSVGTETVLALNSKKRAGLSM